MRRNHVLIVAVLALSLAGSRLPAQETDDPGFITYQGRLTDTVGTPLTGSYDFRFSVYLEGTGGEPLWLEEQTAVAVEEGYYRVDLGKVTAISQEAFVSGALFVAVEVRRAGQDTYDALDPRVALGHVPFAYNAQMLDGEGADYYLNAANLTGQVSEGALPSSVARINQSAAFTSLTVSGGVLALGDGSGKQPFSIEVNDGSASRPLIQYNATKRAWEYTEDGVNFLPFTVPQSNSATTFDATQVISGSLDDARLSANVALRTGGNAFSGSQILDGDLVLHGTDALAVPAVRMDLSALGSEATPALKYNLSAARWEFTNDGVLYQPLGGGLTDGSGLDASQIVSGVLDDARLGEGVPRLFVANRWYEGQTFTADLTLVDAGAGAGLPGLLVEQIADGVSYYPAIKYDPTYASWMVSNDGATYQPLGGSGVTGGEIDASQIVSGVLDDARLSTDIPRLSAQNTFAGEQAISGGDLVLVQGTGLSPGLRVQMLDGEGAGTWPGIRFNMNTGWWETTNNGSTYEKVVSLANPGDIAMQSAGNVFLGDQAIAQGSLLFYPVASANVTLEVEQTDGTTYWYPALVFDAAAQEWRFSNDGSTFQAISGPVDTTPFLRSNPAAPQTITATGDFTALSVQAAVGQSTQPVFHVTDSAGYAGLTVMPDGKVGVGTDTPANTLDVYGDLFVSANIYGSGEQILGVIKENPGSAQTIMPTADNTGLVVAAGPGQTAAVFAVHDELGNPRFTVEADGGLALGNPIQRTGRVTLGGSLGVPLVISTGNYTLGVDDGVVLVNTADPSQVITLPDADPSNAGRVYTIKNLIESAYAVDVTTVGGTLIESSTIYSLSPGYGVIVVSDGIIWRVIGEVAPGGV